MILFSFNLWEWLFNWCSSALEYGKAFKVNNIILKNWGQFRLCNHSFMTLDKGEMKAKQDDAPSIKHFHIRNTKGLFSCLSLDNFPPAISFG
ncbi:CLUMA_CG007128, isoform A [Clunio marinus]|uniref:CLUMA_CG007128, isoform A n=1 Tax=Clunio marinus TaxID=568069 RepID=A0A1J1I055_9DIPT|nr:CLUMA_CG007128, isoform A [Clunio marinus]